MERLRKRKWKPVICKDTGKWYTGWQGLVMDDSYDTAGKYQIVEVEHQMQFIHLTPCGMSRGRSAGNFEFKDKDDFTYTMSMSGTYALLAALAAGIVEASDEVYSGWRLPCVQAKQGANYFIEVFYIDE